MYVINERLSQKIYDGGLQYTPVVKIGEDIVDNSNIKSLEISDPIIDNESKFMYLGTFISKKLTLEFRNLQSIDFNAQIRVSIKVKDPLDSEVEEETVTLGIFNIDSSPKDYYEKTQIVALDNGVKFLPRFETMANVVGDGISAENLLIALCQYYDVELGTYPISNKNATTSFVDNTISGKQYISYIAEIMGGFAKIDRLGKLNIISVKSLPVSSINALASKTFKLGEKYKIDGVFYDNGKFEHHAPTTGWEQLEANKLAIRQDNIFMTGSPENRESIIQSIYNAVQGLEIYSIEIENFIDITLDSYDIVNYSLGEENYLTYYNYNYKYNGGTPVGKVNTQIPTQAVEETTNTIVSEESVKEEIRSIRTTVNQQEATLTTVSNRTTVLENSGFVNIEQVREEIAPDRVAIGVVNTTIENGVPKVNAEGFTFDNTGLNLARTNETGEYVGDVRSKLDEKSFAIIENSTNNVVLYVGYDDDMGETTVITQNTTVKHYLQLDNVSRWQNYKYVDETYRTNIDNTIRTGFFWIGNEGDE